MANLFDLCGLRRGMYPHHYLHAEVSPHCGDSFFYCIRCWIPGLHCYCPWVKRDQAVHQNNLRRVGQRDRLERWYGKLQLNALALVTLRRCDDLKC